MSAQTTFLVVAIVTGSTVTIVGVATFLPDVLARFGRRNRERQRAAVLAAALTRVFTGGTVDRRQVINDLLPLLRVSDLESLTIGQASQFRSLLAAARPPTQADDSQPTQPLSAPQGATVRGLAATELEEEAWRIATTNTDENIDAEIRRYRVASKSHDRAAAAEAKARLGALLLRRGDPEASVLLEAAVTEGSPSISAQSALLLARYLSANAPNGGALRWYERAMQVNHSVYSSLAGLELADALLARGQNDRAREMLALTLSRPDIPAPQAALGATRLAGILLRYDRDDKQAESLLELAAASGEPIAAVALMELVQLHMARREIVRARETLNRWASTLDPGGYFSSTRPESRPPE